jgi:hypothetical protein
VYWTSPDHVTGRPTGSSGPSGFTNSRRPAPPSSSQARGKPSLSISILLDGGHFYIYSQILTWGPVLILYLKMSTPEQSSPRSVLRGAHRPTRVLACVLCQQRKVRCDREFPCANCVRAQVQCVPATQVRRRRRYPEKDLLERVRRYEDLLRQNNIQFQPLHNSVMEQASSSTDHGGYDGTNDDKSERNPQKEETPESETKYEAKSAFHRSLHCLWLTFYRNFWRVMNEMVCITLGLTLKRRLT